VVQRESGRRGEEKLLFPFLKIEKRPFDCPTYGLDPISNKLFRLPGV